MSCTLSKMVNITSLVLLLVLSAALVASMENRDCQDLPIPAQNPITIPLGGILDLSVFSLIFHGEGTTGWEATFKLGKKGTVGSFSSAYNLLVRKSTDPKKKQFTVRFYKEGERAMPLLDNRLSTTWLSEAEISLIVSQSQLSLVFKKDDRQLKVELSIQMDEFDAIEVKLTTNMKVDNASLCSLLPATTTISTTDSTTTTTDPTTTTTTAATTQPPSTAEDATNTASTALGPELPDPSTTTSPCEVVKAGVAEAAANRKDCHAIPWWTWVCVGLMTSFVIFFFISLAYTLILYRRNWSMAATLMRQGQFLRGRIQPAGGYGEEAQDMQYYAMNNQNLMVGSTMPHLACTPSPLPPLSPTPSPLPPPVDPTPSPLPPSVDPTPSPLPPSVDPTPSPLPPPVDPTTSSPLPPVYPTPSPLFPPPPIHSTMPRNSYYGRSYSHHPEIEFPPPPETPLPPSFLTLPASAGQRSYLRDGLSSELCPLQDKMNFQRSEDGMADDEESDVSLSGEYGLRI